MCYAHGYALCELIHYGLDLVSHKFLKKRQVHLSCIATKKQENSRAYKLVAALF